MRIFLFVFCIITLCNVSLAKEVDVCSLAVLPNNQSINENTQEYLLTITQANIKQDNFAIKINKNVTFHLQTRNNAQAGQNEQIVLRLLLQEPKTISIELNQNGYITVNPNINSQEQNNNICTSPLKSSKPNVYIKKVVFREMQGQINIIIEPKFTNDNLLKATIKLTDHNPSYYDLPDSSSITTNEIKAQIIKKPFKVKIQANKVEQGYGICAYVFDTTNQKIAGTAVEYKENTNVNNPNSYKDLGNFLCVESSKLKDQARFDGLLMVNNKKGIDYDNLEIRYILPTDSEINSANSLYQLIPIAKSNLFSARPAYFAMAKENLNQISLIGGKNYVPKPYSNSNTTNDENLYFKDTLKALDFFSQVAVGYNKTFFGKNSVRHYPKNQEFKRITGLDEKCTFSQTDQEYKIAFNNGLGTIYNKENDNFVYNNIGHTIVDIKDIQAIKHGHCLPNSSPLPPDTEIFDTPISCHTQMAQESNFNSNPNNTIAFYHFKPNEIALNKIILSDMRTADLIGTTYYSQIDENLTYDEYQKAEGATINLELAALLFDNTTAELYNDQCYAKDVEFDITYIPRQPDNFNSTYKDKLIAKFFGVNTQSENIAVGSSNHFMIKKSNFKLGKAQVKLKVNFGRDFNQTKPNIIVFSDEFKNIIGQDSDGVKIKSHIKSDNASSANFFYAMLYVPEQKIDENPKDITAYYSVFCVNDCEKYNTVLLKNGSLPENFYINKTHNDHTNIEVYELGNKESIISSNIQNTANGMQIFTLTTNNNPIYGDHVMAITPTDKMAKNSLLHSQNSQPKENLFIIGLGRKIIDNAFKGFGKEGDVMGIKGQKNNEIKTGISRRLLD